MKCDHIVGFFIADDSNVIFVIDHRLEEKKPGRVFEKWAANPRELSALKRCKQGISEKELLAKDVIMFSFCPTCGKNLR